MVVEQLLHLGYDNAFFHYSLKAVAERRLNIDIDKTTRGEIIWRGLDDSVIVYAAGDVMYLEDIKALQEEQCEKQTCKIAAKIENSFVPVIAYLEWCGIRLDEKKWKLKIEDNERQRDEALEQLNKWVVNMYKEKGAIQNLNTVEVTEEFILAETYPGKSTKFYTLPKDAIVVGPSRQVYRDYATFTVVDIKNKVPFVEVNLQGDLFSGFDLEPKCVINWASAKQVIPFVQYLGFDTSSKDKKTGEIKDSVVEKEMLSLVNC